MKLTTFLVIASVLTAKTCRPEIVVTSSSDKSTSNLVEVLVKIVTSCYGNRLHTVGLAGSLPDALSRTLSAEHLVPVVLVDEARSDTKHVFHLPGKFQHKVHVFVIGATTSRQLDDIIEGNIKLSIWWNHMASFLIVDRSSRCANSGKFLLRAWNNNILNAKVLCYGRKSATIFNYNPFTDKAPFPWQRYDVRHVKNDHPFTLFSRKYRANESICLNLDFEKTKDLGGYEIRLTAKESYWKLYKWLTDHRSEAQWQTEHMSDFKWLEDHKNDVQYRLTTGNMHHIVSRTLNGKLIYTRKNSVFRVGHHNNIAQFPFSSAKLWPKYHMTYPYTFAGTIFISQFRGYKGQINEIFSAVDVQSQIGIGIVYIVTLIFFKFCLHHAIVPTLLNILRLTVNTGFVNLPDNTASRIYVNCLFFFAMIMQGVIQCDLAALLSIKIPLGNVNTLEDRQTFGYKVCVHYAVDDPYIDKRFILHADDRDCWEFVKNDSSYTFYTFGFGSYLDKAQGAKLHVSQEFIQPYPMSFSIRPDWFLVQQYNRIMTTLVEADVTEPWNIKFFGMQLTDYQYDEEMKNIESYKQLELRELAFAFNILAIGHAFATFFFIVELVIAHKITCKCTCSVTIDRRQV